MIRGEAGRAVGADPGSAGRRAVGRRALLALATALGLATPAKAAPGTPAHAAPAENAPDASGPGLARVRAAGVLRWGMDQQGGEPYVYEDPDHPGRLVGFEVELADALARQLGVRAEAVQNDWPMLLASLERGTFDVAMNGIEVTPATAARASFSRPYYLFSERLVARGGDTSVRDLPSLRGKRVGTLAATQAWQMLRDAGSVAVPYEGVDEPFIDLDQRRTDAVLLDDIIVDRYVPRHPGLRVVGDVGLGRYAIAVRPDEPALLHALDRALATVLASGELRRILARYGLDSPRQDGLAAASALAVPDAPDAAPAGAGANPGATPPAPSVSGAALARPAPFRLRHLWLFVHGALMTLLVSAGAMLLAVPLGLGLALARLYLPRWGWLAAAYVELFRGTPVLLQLYVLYYGLAPVLSLGPLASAILGLGLNYAAYEAEIHRAGIAAVPPGQMEAALALGMTRRLALRRVVLPQALRVALPGIANDFIALLKDSSLVSVITVVELTKRMSITAIDTHGWLAPGLACAGLYLLMSLPLARLARRLERRLDPRAARDRAGPSSGPATAAPTAPAAGP